MPDTLAGFPFWTLPFDKEGKSQTDAAGLVRELRTSGLTDLWIFSHGWNNSPAVAHALYQRFFGEVRKLVDDPATGMRSGRQIGVAGVVWPSILFPGDAPSVADGGAASFTPVADAFSADDFAAELAKVFNEPEQQPLVARLTNLLATQESSNDALVEFRDTLQQLLTPKDQPATQDDLELRIAAVDEDRYFAVLQSLSAPQSLDDTGGGAASFGGFFSRLWDGAKNLLRVGTFWEMKNRAGIIGTAGLGPLIGSIHEALPELRIHLAGHSFGARVVSYALSGLPDDLAGAQSPVKSLFLLQGAFSHFAFSSHLPFDAARHGDLSGMAARVDGPLLTTFSLKDLAVGNAYPAAALVAGQDAADASDLLYRWQGMGYDGAQAVDAGAASLGSPGTVYRFEKGRWLNLDGNLIIVNGGPPSGAHGDIAHPETAWAALAAAGLASAEKPRATAGGGA